MTRAKAEPSLAVIIPAYNVGEYIEESLQTLCDQTCMPDEVIVIDDGSSDDTIKKINSMLCPFPLKVISTENRGQGAARNTGISLSESDYLYFFDSDDLLEAGFIEWVKGVVRCDPEIDLVLFSGESFVDSRFPAKFNCPSYQRGFQGEFYSSLDLISRFVEVGTWSVSPCLYVSRRDFWGEGGLEFLPYYYEDAEVFYRLLDRAARFYVSERVFFRRRIRKDSTMTMRKTDKHVFGHAMLIATLVSIKNREKNPLVTRFTKIQVMKVFRSYISTSRELSIPIDYKLVLRTLVTFKDPTLFAVCVISLLGDRGYEVLSGIYRAVRLKTKR